MKPRRPEAQSAGHYLKDVDLHMSFKNITAQVVCLPGAAESKVVQTRVRGRLPNAVARLHVARFERRKHDEQIHLIEQQIESIERMIECSEQVIANARLQLQQLRQLQPGTPLAGKVCEYLEWHNLPWQEKERWKSYGFEPKDWPL